MDHSNRSGNSCPSGLTTMLSCKILPLLLFAALASVSGGTLLADDYAERTPGHRYVEAGKRAHSHRQYSFAMRQFQTAAGWSDKIAQFNLGAMHYRGEGTAPESARAWAWFELAAERRYPLFVDVANQVWAELDTIQQERALGILENELLPQYGDAVTVPRTIRHMTRNQRQATGSRLGAASGALVVYQVDGASYNPFTGRLTMYNATRTPGPEFYAAEKWDFEHIMALEAHLFDAESQGQVRIGDFHIIEDELD